MEPKPNNANNPYGFPEDVVVEQHVVLSREQAEAAVDNPIMRIVLRVQESSEFSRGRPGHPILNDFVKGMNSARSELNRIIDRIGVDDSYFMEDQLVNHYDVLNGSMVLGVVLHGIDTMKKFERRATAISDSAGFNDIMQQINAEFVTKATDLAIPTTSEEEAIRRIQEFSDQWKQIVFSMWMANPNQINYEETLNYESFVENHGLGNIFRYIVEGLDASEVEDDLVNDRKVKVHLGRLICNMAYIDESAFTRFQLRGTPTQKSAARFASRVARNFKVIRGRMREVLFDPSDDEHSQLRREAIEAFKNTDGFSKAIAISYFSDERGFMGLYRDAYFARENFGDEELYQGVMDMILHSIESGQSDPSVVLLDDVDLVVVEKPVDSDFSSPNQEETINSIIANSSKQSFELDPQQIEWVGILPPKNVSIQFEKDHPYNYEFSLTYESEIGEELNLTIKVDARSMKLDWNILQSPDEAKELAAVFMRTGGEILKQVESVTSQLFEMRHQEEVTLAPPVPKKKKGLKRSPTHQSRPHHKQAPKEIDVTNISSYKEQGQPTVKMIIIPDEKTFSRMLSSFSSVDREIIVEAIREFNDTGRGRFKQLKTNKKVNEKLYELRVRRQSGGAGIRVVVSGAESGEGFQNFNIAVIEDRDSVFKNFWK